MNSRKIEKKDVLDLNSFAAIRKTKRAEITEIKKHRRVPVGPDATFYFESYDTMWWQIHEMLFIEKGGDEQVNDDLEAYNPLIPQGDELVATLMFEIDDPARRKDLLMKLGGVEEMCFLEVGQDKVKADAETDVDRTSAQGKASSVQFLHFKLSSRQLDLIKQKDTSITLSIEHPEYGHSAKIQGETREALLKDFD